MDVEAPATGKCCGKVGLSDASDVAAAVANAKAAFPGWSGMTIKGRAAIMFKLHQLISEHADELAQIATLENGKTYTVSTKFCQFSYRITD